MTLEMEFERLRLASIEAADASYEDYRRISAERKFCLKIPGILGGE